MNEQAYVKPNGAEVAEPPPVHFVEERETVRQSTGIDKLIEALAKAQGEFEPIVKDTQNPFFKSKYADLATIIAATKGALSKNGLSIMQLPLVEAHFAGVRTILAHSSGQYISTDLMLPAAQGSKFDAQTVGSALTYARRYALQAILGVAADVDDDGNLAAGNNGSKQAAQDVAKQKLEELAKNPKPEIAAMAKDSLAKIRAQETAHDLEGQLRASVPKAVIPKDEALESSVEAAKDDGLFDEFTGVIQQVREMATSKEKGSKPYRRIAFTVSEEGDGYRDIEIVSWDNFVLSNGKLWDFLKGADGSFATFICEVGSYKGKPSYTLKDVKKIGSRTWDARLGD